MFWVLGAVAYLAILVFTFALMRVSGEADKNAERMYLEWQRGHGELKKQTNE